MNKKSFILYKDQRNVWEALPPKECKELLLAIFDFAEGKNKKLSPLVNIAFLSIRNQLTRDFEKWEKELKSRSEAGKKGMRNRWHSKGITKDNSVIGVITPITDNVNVNVNENVNVKRESRKTNSFTPCDAGELYKTSVELNVSLDHVKRKHGEILELVQTGEMLRRYPRNSSTYMTLRSWLRRDLTAGLLQPMTDVEKLKNEFEEPTKARQWKKLKKAAKERGSI